MDNQLAVLVQESGLETTKAQCILDKFQDYFSIAADWEQKAKTIIVTSNKQTAEMQMARAGRLFLRDKRLSIEKARKELKEQALREGKAIDGIANVLKALIVPIEEYLEKQEKFVELQAQAEAEAKRLEIERKIEEERIAKEKADAEERERIRLENERLKKEAIEKERLALEERKKQEAILAAERERARKEREEAEKAIQAERARAQEIQRQTEEKARLEREKLEAEKRASEEKARQERLAAQAKAETERKEKERLEALLKNQIECPFCHKKFAPTKGGDAQ